MRSHLILSRERRPGFWTAVCFCEKRALAQYNRAAQGDRLHKDGAGRKLLRTSCPCAAAGAQAGLRPRGRVNAYVVTWPHSRFKVHNSCVM